MPSEFESFGLALAEGLWAGVPVVATRTGLAKLVAGIVREIPVGASGPVLAAAVLADAADPVGTRDRVSQAQAFVRKRLTLARLRQEWMEFLATVVQARAVQLARVQNGPDRGSVLPLSQQDDCGCAGKELSECRKGKGSVPGRVRLRDCLACQTTPL
jgi:hypothetical protein